MADDDRDIPLRMTPDTRTPCCSRVPKHVEGRRYVCRGCGTIYVDQAALIRQVFPGAIDVTVMTPRRFLNRRRKDSDDDG